MLRYSIFVVILMSWVLCISGQPGIPDHTFGNKGQVIFNFSKANASMETGLKSRIIADGKVMVVFRAGSTLVSARLLADGSLDPGYGAGGFAAMLAISALQADIFPDGQIIFRGSKQIIKPGNQGSYPAIALAKIDSEGNPDITFDGDGVLILPEYSSIFDFPFNIQPDGKILLTDVFQNYLMIIRLNPNGSFDPAFGNNGVVLTSFEEYHYSTPTVKSILLTSENQIVLVGTTYNWVEYNTYLLKYHSDGSPDNSFDSDGIYKVSFELVGGFSPFIQTGFLQGDGKIVLGGSIQESWSNTDFFLSRLLPDGTLDNTFNQNGYLIKEFGTSNDVTNSVLVTGAGKIYATSGPVTAACFNPDGTPDVSFGENGIVKTQINGNPGQSNHITLFHPDELVITGLSVMQPVDCVVIKLKSDGSNDNTFSEDGIASIFMEGGISDVSALHKQPDGKLICVGTEATGSGDVSMAFFRMLEDGSADPSFGTNGKLVTGLTNLPNQKISAMQKDGKILLAKYEYENSRIYRFNTDGSQDAAFQSAGLNLFPGINGFILQSILKMQVQADDRILILGMAADQQNYYHNALVVFRLTKNGYADTSFGTNGMVVLPAGKSTQLYETPRGFYDAELLLRKDEKITLAASLMDMPPYWSYGMHAWLARINPNGTVDTSFGEGGTKVGSFIYEPDINAVIQSDNKVVFNSYLEVLRFNEDGSPDNGFGNSGKIQTSTGGILSLQEDGKIIKAGMTYPYNLFYLERYKPDGTADLTFGLNGRAETIIGSNNFNSVATLMISDMRLYAGGFINSPFQSAIIAAFNLSDIQLECPSGKTATTALNNCSVPVDGIDPVFLPVNASAPVKFTLSGATSGSGSGTASGKSFYTGITSVTYSLESNPLQTCSFNVEVSYPVTPGIDIIPSDVANDFCNGILLTASGNVPASGYEWNNGMNTPTNFLTVANPSGKYTVKATAAQGCPDIPDASYDYDNQAVVSSYTLLGLKGIRLQQNNTVLNGSVGVVDAEGLASLKRNVSIAGPGAFLKSPDISLQPPVDVPAMIYEPVNVTLPEMRYNTSSTAGLPNGNVPDNTTTTLAGNLKNVNIGTNCTVDLTGDIFGNITVGSGSTLLFTQPLIHAGSLTLNPGLPAISTKLTFSGDAVILCDGNILVNSGSVMNPDNHKVVIYMGKTGKTPSMFTVASGGNVTVNAGIYLPAGKISAGGDETNMTFMNGKFIAENIETGGKNVVWNWFECSVSNTPPLTVLLKSGSIDPPFNPVEAKRLSIKAWPNPGRVEFNIRIESSSDHPVELRVFDIYGRQVYLTVGQPDKQYNFGKDLKPGLYLAEILQGNARSMVKLVKQQE